MAKREADATPRSRAFAFLIKAINTGTYLPGDAIRIADVARELNLSGTPVREALCRLAGIRLVEDRQREGFRMAQLSSDEIAAAYQFEATLYDGIIAGLSGRGVGPLQRRHLSESKGMPAAGAPPSALTILQLLAADGLTTGYAIDIARRLAPYRRWESEVVPQAAAYTLGFDEAVDREDWQTSRVMLSRYAQSRISLAHRLLAAGTLRR